MKKLFALLICLLLLFTLVSCGDDPCSHRDADDNSLCDECGESYTDGKDVDDSTPCSHRDADDNSLCDNCGESYTDGKDLPDEHTHDYTVKNTDSKYLDKIADCENAATYFYSCSCGAKGMTTFTSGSANGHSYTVKSTDNKYLDKAADCENAATYFYSCSCGEKGSETFTSGSANGHEYTVKNTDSKYLDKAADCENAATYFYSCSCGAKGATTFTNGSANGHSYTVKSTDSKYLDKAADCENAATYFYSCSCGAKGTTTFTHGNANGHNYVIQNVDPKYEKTPASEYTPAVYWKSCSCGKASTTETFNHGDMLPGYLTYQLSLDSSFYIVSGFVGAQSDISVPNLHDGLPVFGIMASAFKDNTTIRSITMPNSIIEIGSYAFAGCTSLESIIIPTSVTNIADHTFSGCTALKTITLHSGIDTLGAFAFEKCSALKSITLNEGLETISDNAFDFCTALESISIPDTVTSLGNMAFRHAEALRSVKFSSSLESIGNATFQYCVNLQSVELHENINTLGSSTFSYCDGLKSIRILGDLESIGLSTFYECRSLTSIYFASKTPGDCGNTNYIFYNAGIEGDGITLTIAKDAVVPDGFFTPYVEDNMPKITKIVIEDGNTTVGGFKNYNKLPYLTSIVYPDTITDSAYGAFNNSLWWNNQEIGEVFINGIFYGYKCHCTLSTPADAVTENYVDSTCTEDGGYDTVIYCEVCNDELKRTYTVIPEKGHSPKTAVEENRVEATCTEDGHYDIVVYCNRCDGEVSRTTETITKLGHSPKTAVEENRVEATCVDGHYDSVVYCNRCDEELSRQTITIPASHTPKSAVEENRVEATCTEDGHYDSVVYCNTCGDEISRTKETISKKAHTPNSAIEENRVEAMTCTDGHYDIVVYCNRCSDELSRQTVIIPAAHKYINGACTECGKIVYTRDGNYIYFGEYPQTLKADSVTITSTQDSRGYYLGSDGCYYAKVVADPYTSGYTFSTGATVSSGTTYYFKVEPIRWRILSEDGETALILCDSIIANKAYQSSHSYNSNNGKYYTTANGAPSGTYENNYKYSEVRAWLNAEFYITAFNELQRELILTTTVDNSVYSTEYSSNPYACENTNDKIFLLSYREVTNSAYGFSSDYSSYDTARRMQTSDYSRASGVFMYTNSSYYGNGCWWLRSPDSSGCSFARVVVYRGNVDSNNYVSNSNRGVVPALRIRL